MNNPRNTIIFNMFNIEEKDVKELYFTIENHIAKLNLKTARKLDSKPIRGFDFAQMIFLITELPFDFKDNKFYFLGVEVEGGKITPESGVATIKVGGVEKSFNFSEHISDFIRNIFMKEIPA